MFFLTHFWSKSIWSEKIVGEKSTQEAKKNLWTPFRVRKECWFGRKIGFRGFWPPIDSCQKTSGKTWGQEKHGEEIVKNPCQEKPMGFSWFFHFSSFIFLSGPKTGKSIFLHNEHLYLTRKGILRFFLIFGDVFSPNFFSLFQKSVSGKTPVFFLILCSCCTSGKTWVGEKNQKKWWGPDRPKKNFDPIYASGTVWEDSK